jgi:hypothetical protein
MTVPTRSAVTSRKFGGSTSGGRGGVGSGLSVMESSRAQAWHRKGEAEPATFRCHCDTGLLKPIRPERCGIAHGSASPGRGTIGGWHWPGRSEARDVSVPRCSTRLWVNDAREGSRRDFARSGRGQGPRSGRCFKPGLPKLALAIEGISSGGDRYSDLAGHCRRGLPHQGARRFPRTMARRIPARRGRNRVVRRRCQQHHCLQQRYDGGPEPRDCRSDDDLQWGSPLMRSRLRSTASPCPGAPEVGTGQGEAEPEIFQCHCDTGLLNLTKFR